MSSHASGSEATTEPPGEVPPGVSEVPSPLAGLLRHGGAGALSDDPRAALDRDGVIALQGAAGNRAIARAVGGPAVLRQHAPQPAPAPAPAGPAGAPAPAGGMTAQQSVILSAAILGVSNAFNHVYLAQKTGLDQLRRDLGKKDEPGLTESVVWAMVDAALGAGVQRVAALIATKVGTVAVDRLSKPVTEAINSVGTTLSPQTHEQVFTIAIEQAGRKRAADLSTAVSGWAGGKVSAGSAATRSKISSDLDEIEKFLQGQELTLVDHLAEKQGEVTGAIAPSLSAAPFAEAMTAAVAMREAATDARIEADTLQYLASSAAWERALAGGGASGDAPLAQGARGVLFVQIPEDPAADFRIVSAKIDGMQDEMRKRLRSTPAFQQRPLSDWPMPTVIQNSSLYLAVQGGGAVDDGSVRLGHGWLGSRGKARYNMETLTPASAKVAGALLHGELRRKTINDIKSAFGT